MNIWSMNSVARSWRKILKFNELIFDDIAPGQASRYGPSPWLHPMFQRFMEDSIDTL